MTLPNQSKLRKFQLANSKRVERMGLHNDKAVQFMLKLSLSPIPDVAFKFTHKLNRMLDEMEFRHAIHGCEVLPVLGSDISIEIGKTVSKGESYRIKIDDLTTHMAVAGTTGSGKTNLASLIVKALEGVVRMILFDHKDEGLRFFNMVANSAYLPPENQRWNPLCGAGTQSDYIRFVSSQLAKLMALLPVTTNAMRAKLLHLCSGTNLPSIADLPALFTALAKQEMRTSLHTASRGFEDLAVTMGRWAEVRQGNWPFDNHPLCIIPMKDCPETFEYFLIAILFKQLTDRASVQGHDAITLKQCSLFDEGRNFFGKEFEPMRGSGRTNLQSTILTKMRSYGIGCIICTQSITGIQQSVIDNAGIFMAFRTNSEQEAKACCRRLGIDESRYMELVNMEVGTAWIVSPQCRQPVKIRVPFVDLGDYPSEMDIIRRVEPLWNEWDKATVFAPVKDDLDSIPDFREILGEIEPQTTIEQTEPEESETLEKGSNPIIETAEQPAPNTSPILAEYFTLLHSCEANPDFAVTAHYKAQGLSARRGNRIKTKLIELGWVEAVRIAPLKAGRPKETLQLTGKGKGVLDEHA